MIVFLTLLPLILWREFLRVFSFPAFPAPALHKTQLEKVILY